MLQWKAISTVQSTASCQYLSSNASIVDEYSKLKEGWCTHRCVMLSLSLKEKEEKS
jgi:hypothetical protein